MTPSEPIFPAGTAPVLTLASASPRRHALIARLGVPFRVECSGVDESRIAAPTPREFALKAARAKWEDVAARQAPGTPTLAADTIVCFDPDGVDDGAAPSLRPGATLLGKPRDAAEARDMLRRLSARTHEVATAVAFGPAGETPTLACESSRVRFREIPEPEIAAYVETGESLDKAGAYAVQGGGAAFIEAVQGDLQNVIGLPMRLVHDMLLAVWPGLELPQFDVFSSE